MEAAAAGPEEPSAAPEGRAAASAAGRTGPPSRRPSRSRRPASTWLLAGGWEERSERIRWRSSASQHRQKSGRGRDTQRVKSVHYVFECHTKISFQASKKRDSQSKLSSKCACIEFDLKM